MQAFFVSIFAGVLFPVTPIFAELGLAVHLKSETLSATAVVYTAAVGLVSRNQLILISSLFCSLICTMIYTIDALSLNKGSLGSILFVKHGEAIASAAIYAYAACYVVERFARHVIEKEPFLEL